MNSQSNLKSTRAMQDDLENLLKLQSEQWKSGNRVTVEQLNNQLDHDLKSSDTDFLMALICHEITLRESSGDHVQLAEYQTRFPQLADELAIQWQIDRLMSYESATTEARNRGITLQLSSHEGRNDDKPKRPPLPPFIGRYEILSELGRGGVGVVYEAWDPKLKRRVAIKRLRLGLDSSADDLVRFRSEAESVAAIRHQNVVQIFDVGEDNGQPYLAVEICSGGTLSKRLAGKPMAPRAAAELVQKIANGISAAHDNRVIHRDLKPSNILLENGDGLIPKISDFGLAKHLDTDGVSTRTGFIVGTPAYMAPEQTEGEHQVTNVAIDIYALGTILYECLTGRAPFKGINVSETLELVRKNEPLGIRRLEPSVPIDLETIAMKCLRKEPEQRYASAKEMGKDLQRFLEHRPILAKRKKTIEHFASWCRRNPMLSAAVFLVATILAVSIGLLSWMSGAKTQALKDKTQALQEKSVALEQREAAYGQSRLSERMANQRYYDTRINSAQQSILRNETSRAEDLIRPFDYEQSGFVGYEWKLLRKALFQNLKWNSSRPVGGEAIDLEMSPNGKYVLAVGGHQTRGFYRLYDAADGKLIFDEILPVTINACGFAPQSNKFVVCEGDGTIRFLSIDDAESVGLLETKLSCKSMAWGKSGDVFYVGDERGKLGVFDVAATKHLTTIDAETGPIMRMFISDDQKRLYTSTDWGNDGKHSTAWDITNKTPEKLRTFSDMSISDESKDGTTICGMNWGDLILADAATGSLLQSHRISSGPLLSVGFNESEDMLLIAARYERELRIVDRKTLETKHSYPMPHSISAAHFSDNRMVTGDIGGELRFWDSSTGKKAVYETDPNTDYRFARFLPNSHDVLLGSSDVTKAWSPVGNVIRPLDRATDVVAASSNGETLISHFAASDDQCELTITRKTDPKELRLSVPYKIYEQNICLSDSGRWLATRGNGTKIDVYDLNTAVQTPKYQLDALCVLMSFSPDDSKLAAGVQGGEVRCFDLISGAQMPNFAEWQSYWSWGRSTAFSLDGKYLASGTESGLINVWEVQTRKLMSQLTGAQGEVRCLAFFPDERRIVSGGASDVRIWDYQAGQELLSLNVPHDSVDTVEVSTDSNAILALAGDGRVYVWTVE